MKGGIAAAAVAAMATGAQAAYPNHRHAHNLFKRGVEEVCVPSCTTVWTTYYGEATLVPNPPPVAKTTKVVDTTTHVVEKPTKTPEPKPEPVPEPKTTSEAAPKPTTSAEVVTVVPLPTPEAHDCPTPGTYTFPATTVTVTESTTVCYGESTKVPSGTHTLGGVTTVVEKETTVTCPIAKETEHDGTITSVIETTVYVCPTAGTYTIGPVTKSCDEETILVYPVPTSYAPGTYTAPEQVVTVTESNYVYVCPYTEEGAPAPTKEPETPKEPVYEAPKVEKPKVEKPKVEEPKVEEPKEEKPVYESPKEEKPKVVQPKVEKTIEYKAPKATTEPKPKAKKPSSGGSLRGGHDHYGITYTPYESSNGDCKDSSKVDADIGHLKDAGFEIVRSYSTDCNTLESVGGACRKHGLDMMIGVFVKGSGCSYETPDIKEQVDAIAEWAQWDLVKLFVVGNEAIMNGFCSASELSELIKVVKSKCSGYTGPYTIAETLNIWEQPEVAAAICPVIDVTGANIHPYFNSEVEPSTAGEFVAGQLEILGEICSGNDVINLECGWPTRGECNGSACPGKQEQVTAIKSIRESCGDKTVFFSYEDDMWKEPGSCGCEQSWGSKDCF